MRKTKKTPSVFEQIKSGLEDALAHANGELTLCVTEWRNGRRRRRKMFAKRAGKMPARRTGETPVPRKGGTPSPRKGGTPSPRNNSEHS